MLHINPGRGCESTRETRDHTRAAGRARVHHSSRLPADGGAGRASGGLRGRSVISVPKPNLYLSN